MADTAQYVVEILYSMRNSVSKLVQPVAISSELHPVRNRKQNPFTFVLAPSLK